MQVLIATHSPILLAYPEAQILSLHRGAIHEITYIEWAPYQLCSKFLADPDSMCGRCLILNHYSPKRRAKLDSIRL